MTEILAWGLIFLLTLYLTLSLVYKEPSWRDEEDDNER